MTFLSGVVTELLCRHLSWINTVYIDEEQAELDQSLASRSVVNKRWAQLCDLFGIASSPAKCYKIVICGKIQNSGCILNGIEVKCGLRKFLRFLSVKLFAYLRRKMVFDR